ncbi:hypothetical protein [Neorhizobium huautlense]|uniref:hypothetical protein n=1 Tax=Neorhizobium huautlense TaxID=67774 RepID=UPI00197B0BF8|nr:hypothetical protein [Neorhizobium huautlense]
MTDYANFIRFGENNTLRAEEGCGQASSLGAVLGANELFRSAQILIEQTTISKGGSPAYLVYGAILIVYFALCWSISALGARLERHFARPYRKETRRSLKAERLKGVTGASISR